MLVGRMSASCRSGVGLGLERIGIGLSAHWVTSNVGSSYSGLWAAAPYLPNRSQNSGQSTIDVNRTLGSNATQRHGHSDEWYLLRDLFLMRSPCRTLPPLLLLPSSEHPTD